MNGPDRPPLSRLVFEQIELLLDRVDQEHWPVIAEFQVDPAAVAKRPLPLPKTPMALLSVIQTYASMLFKSEADQYGQFVGDRNYAPWLANLENRTISRVLRTVAAIEEANKPATLAHHELTEDEVVQGLGKVLFEIRNGYVWSDTVRLAQPMSEIKSQRLNAPPSDKDDPKTWSPLHQRVAAYLQIKKMMEGPKLEIPESLVRGTLAEQYGCKPEEVTFEQIQFEVSGLLWHYPAIHLIQTKTSPTSPQVAAAETPTFGDALAALLREARLRPEDIAEEIGIGPRNVYRHLAGNTLPTLPNVRRYETALSKRLARKVTLPTPAKRQNVSKKSVKGQ